MADTELAPQEPASDAAPDANAEAQPAAPSPALEAEKPKEPSAIEKMQKRIDQLTWRLRENERQQARPEPQTEPSETAKRPTREEFDHDEAKYLDALEKYFDARAETRAQEALKKDREQREMAERANTFEKRQEEFAKSKSDYREKVLENEFLPITADMAKVIQASEIGPEIAYYLAENEEKAAVIAKLDPFLQARELGRIEALLEANKKAPAVPQVSKAPPPPPKIEATEPAIEKDPSKMTDAEFRKWRLASIARQKSRFK